MAMTTAQWQNTMSLEHFENPLLIHAAEKVFDHDMLFTKENMTAATWQTFQLAGPGTPVTTDESKLVTMMDAFELDTITATAVKWANGYVFSHEWEVDNQNVPGLLKILAKEYAHGHRYVTQVVMTDVFEKAFNSSYPLFDGTEMCGTHTTNSNDTYTNDGGVHDPSWTFIWDAVDYFNYGIVTESGLITVDQPDCIHFHPSDARIIEDVLYNPKKPDTMDNNLNRIDTRNIKMCPNPLLTAGNWFILGKKAKDHIYFLRREPITIEWDNATQNLGRICVIFQRFTTCVVDGRYVYGYSAS